MQTTTGYLDMGDGTLYYEVAGTGQTLVLSHAAFLDSRMFDEQWDVLAHHFRVIRYDMRGYGRSSAVQHPICHRDDLRRLLEYLGVEQAHFVGCSNGGSIALDFALEQPHRLLSLTLVGAAPGGFEMQGEPPRYVMEMIAAMQNGQLEFANELQVRIWVDGSFREPDQVDSTLREKALMMNRIPVERQTFFVTEMEPLCPLDPSALTRLNELTCPVLVVAGALDDPQVLRASDVMVEAIPGAKKAVIEASAHVPSYERPDQFNAVLLNFLSLATRSENNIAV